MDTLFPMEPAAPVADKPEKKTDRRPLTPEERMAIAQMKAVTFPVASWDKRFYRSVSESEEITDKMASQLWRLFIRYRRQINFPAKQRFLEMAERLAAPDFRKQNRVQNFQARIEEMRRAAR